MGEEMTNPYSYYRRVRDSRSRSYVGGPRLNKILSLSIDNNKTKSDLSDKENFVYNLSYKKVYNKGLLESSSFFEGMLIVALIIIGIVLMI
jgi:hypothetical protein